MQQVWRKRWLNTLWILLSASTLVLLVAAMQKKKNKPCAGVKISFVNEGNNYFIDEKGVLEILKTDGEIEGKQTGMVNLKLLESRLEQDNWIADAELFFDNKQVLQVSIQEKEPIARIFTVGGSSYYIDSACNRLPLSDRMSARVPMFTSFPSDRSVLAKPDSQLLGDIKELAMFIDGNDFWSAQVQQIDITPAGFEMYPTVGSHVVMLGKGNYKNKFDRLFSFYKLVWVKVGLERYEKFDLRFDGQVVATIKGARHTLADTAMAKEVIDNLIQKDKKGIDSVVITNSNSPVTPDTIRGSGQVTTAKAKPKVTATKPKPVIAVTSKKPGTLAVNSVIAATQKAGQTKTPKAVMKKNNVITIHH